MGKDTLISCLKEAILFKYKSKEFYASVVTATQHQGVKELFNYLRKEEIFHIKALKGYYQQVARGEELRFKHHGQSTEGISHQVLTEQIVKGISGAGYEAGVISAALGLEKNALEYFMVRAEQATTRDEKDLFTWLTDWERGHMMVLTILNNDLRDKVWHDDNFWSLD